MVENCTGCLQFLADFESYFVEFDFDGRIKEKNYPPRCEIGAKNWQPVIYIKNDQCNFSANDVK